MNVKNIFLQIYWKIFFTILKNAHKQALFKVWKNVVRSRFFEEKIISLVTAGKIKKRWIASGIGQEGGAPAIIISLKKNDWILPSYRGYAPTISKGFPMQIIAAEVLGKKTGPLLGLGASTSFISTEYKIAQHSNILGTDCATAIGIAIALKRKPKDGLIVSFFGDGVATRGTIWSSINLSILWELPILWVCENNQYAVTTHISLLTRKPFYKKAKSFGLKSMMVDGNDPTKVYFSAKNLLSYIRRECKPAFLELNTYRRASHDLFFMTGNNYQLEHKEKVGKTFSDPLETLEKQLLSGHIVNRETISNIRKNAAQEIEESFAWAEMQEEISKEEFLSKKIL